MKTVHDDGLITYLLIEDCTRSYIERRMTTTDLLVFIDSYFVQII